MKSNEAVHSLNIVENEIHKIYNDLYLYNAFGLAYKKLSF